MADILIRGIEIPKGETAYVELQVWGDGKIYKRRGLAGKLQQIGTVIPLPEGHGKIIDGDALWENMTVEQSEAFQKGLAGTIELFEMLEAAIPIVPAEGGTE